MSNLVISSVAALGGSRSGAPPVAPLQGRHTGVFNRQFTRRAHAPDVVPSIRLLSTCGVMPTKSVMAAVRAGKAPEPCGTCSLPSAGAIAVATAPPVKAPGTEAMSKRPSIAGAPKKARSRVGPKGLPQYINKAGIWIDMSPREARNMLAGGTADATGADPISARLWATQPANDGRPSGVGIL